MHVVRASRCVSMCTRVTRHGYRIIRDIKIYSKLTRDYPRGIAYAYNACCVLLQRMINLLYAVGLSILPTFADIRTIHHNRKQLSALIT